MDIWNGLNNNPTIWDNTIYSNKPVEWNTSDNTAIGNSINKNINNQPDYGAVSGAIDNAVNTNSGNGFDWGTFGKNVLKNTQFGGYQQQATPRVNFQPTMIQPQYVNTNFQNQQSNIAKTNLYDYLMR
jgi:hypothetical protein